ncbi:MAG: hypothetical protein ACRDHZ_11095 [Ktedonobacteraceae bacterium]
MTQDIESALCGDTVDQGDFYTRCDHGLLRSKCLACAAILERARAVEQARQQPAVEPALSQAVTGQPPPCLPPAPASPIVLAAQSLAQSIDTVEKLGKRIAGLESTLESTRAELVAAEEARSAAQLALKSLL